MEPNPPFFPFAFGVPFTPACPSIQIGQSQRSNVSIQIIHNDNGQWRTMKPQIQIKFLLPFVAGLLWVENPALSLVQVSWVPLVLELN